jgi:hypothetical protein
MSTNRWVAQQSVARQPTAKRLATEYTLSRSRGKRCLLRAVPSRTAPSAATQQAAMTPHGSTLASKATPCKQWPDATQPPPCSLLRDGPRNRKQCRSYDWGFIRGTEMSKQSVCRSQFSGGVLLSRSSTRESLEVSSTSEQSYEWGLDRRQTREVWRCKVCDNLS